MGSGEQLKYITPITDKTRNEAEEMNSRYREIEKMVEQLGNPNLLDNGGFSVWDYGADNIVNATTGYQLGRWLFWTDGLPFDVARGFAGGIVIDNKLSDTITMTQVILFNRLDFAYGNEKTVTISINDDAYVTTITVKLGKDMEDIVAPTTKGLLVFRKLYKGTEDNKFVVEYLALKSKGATRLIHYIKMEYGEIATPFFPKPQAVEELECSRYHRWLTTGTTGAVTDSTSVVLSARFENPMRITPTVRVKNQLVASSANQYMPPITNPVIMSYTLNKDGIQFIHVGGGADIQLPINSRIVLQSENVIELDANIYP